MSKCITDDRDQRYIDHSLEQLLSQRIYQIAAGYEDANDCDELRRDNYGENCFMPLHIYEGLSGKLITTILKPGRRSKATNVFAILKRVIDFIRNHWCQTKIIIRGDSHFCSQELMDWTKGQYKVSFITGLIGNQKLHKLSEKTKQAAEKLYAVEKKPVKKYHTFAYKAEQRKCLDIFSVLRC